MTTMRDRAKATADRCLNGFKVCKVEVTREALDKFISGEAKRSGWDWEENWQYEKELAIRIALSMA